MTEQIPFVDENYVYVVATQTGTILSRVLKAVTHSQYNHVSVSVDPTLNTMYSFGRKNPYNPFLGGFVMESPHFGTFKRFSETDSVVLCLPVTEEQKKHMELRLREMYEHRQEYTYNVLGLFLAALRIQYRKKNSYYCSEFVKSLLEEFHLVEDGAVGNIPKPVEFLELQGGYVVYRGKLRLFDRDVRV